MSRPARALGRRRACAIGSGAWQAVMGGKGGLVIHGAGSPTHWAVRGAASIAMAPLESAFPPGQSPLSTGPGPPGPAGDPMNDNSSHTNTPRDEAKRQEAPSPPKPAPPGARKSDPRAAERLAAALRENLRRRKQQAKARRSDAAPAEGQGQD